MMSFNWAQCPMEDKLQLLLSTGARGQSAILSSSKLSQKPLHFSSGHNASFILERGRESQNSSALVFVQIVLARPQPVFQWTCSFRGQGILPGRSQFNRSEGDTYQSKVLWLEYTEGNWELLPAQVLSWVCSLHVLANIIKTGSDDLQKSFTSTQLTAAKRPQYVYLCCFT